MSHETWVVNASPLIALAKVGQLQLLERPGQLLLSGSGARRGFGRWRDGSCTRGAPGGIRWSSRCGDA
jgi:hypothetical protein